MADTEIMKLKKKVSLLEDALLDAAGALIQCQALITQLRAGTTSERYAETKSDAKELGDRVTAMIEHLSESVNV